MEEQKTVTKQAGWMTTAKERWSYYIGYSAISGQNAIVTSYFSTFVLLMGVNLSVIATVTLIIKGIDAIDDIIFGFLVDKIKLGNSRLSKLVGKGSYLPWIRASFLLLPISTIILFNMPGQMSDVLKIIWFSLGYLFWDLSYTMIDIPVNAVITTMTTDSDERNSLIAYRSFPQLVLVLAVGSVATVLISEGVGIPLGRAALLMSVVLLVFILPVATGVREHAPRVVEADEKYTFKDMVAYLKGNRFLLILYGGYIIEACLNTGVGVWLFVAFYLFNNSLFAIIYYVAAMLSVLVVLAFAPSLARKFGKGPVMRVMAFVTVLTGAIVYLAGYNSIVLHVAVYILHLFPSAFAGVMIGFACLDCIEYGKYKTGVDGAGISFAITSFATKMTNAIASALGLLLLGLFHWIPIEATDFAELAAMGVTQTEQALRGLWFVTNGMPVIGYLFCAIFWSQYKLKDADVAVMIRFNQGEITREEAESQMSRVY